MKKLLLTSMVLFGCCGSFFSQAFNGGFETWGATANEPIQPTGWITANLFASPFLTLPNPNPNPTSAFQSTNPNIYMGMYSLRLVTVELQYNPSPTTIPDTLGACITGSFTMIPTFTMKDRINFTGRPAMLDFAAQYTPNGVDTASIFVQLTKWNTSTTSRDIVMEMWFPIAPGSTWNNYTVPLTTSYLMPILPDSMSVAITASGYYAPQLGSQLHIDNVSFSGYVGVDENDKTELVSVYPNPASESLTVDASSLNADLSLIEIMDVNGKVVMSQSMKNVNSLTVDIRTLPAGNYSYVIRGIQGIGMGNGKFTVVK